MTAIEELISFLKENEADINGGGCYWQILSKATSLLEKEEEQIQDAFEDGNQLEVPDSLYYGLKYTSYNDWKSKKNN